MDSCGGEKRGILLPATERKEVRTQDGAGKAGCGQGTGKPPESHRITLSTNKNIIVEFTNDTINRSE